MSLTFGVDQLCRFCGGSKRDRHGSECMACRGSGFAMESAVARRSDPPTSRAAAASLSSEAITAAQKLVLDILKRHGPMTDEGLVAVAQGERQRGNTALRLSPSGARTRRHELEVRGYVVAAGKRRLSTGRFATTWKAVSK